MRWHYINSSVRTYTHAHVQRLHVVLSLHMSCCAPAGLQAEASAYSPWASAQQLQLHQQLLQWQIHQQQQQQMLFKQAGHQVLAVTHDGNSGSYTLPATQPPAAFNAAFLLSSGVPPTAPSAMQPASIHSTAVQAARHAPSALQCSMQPDVLLGSPPAAAAESSWITGLQELLLHYNVPGEQHARFQQLYTRMSACLKVTRQ